MLGFPDRTAFARRLAIFVAAGVLTVAATGCSLPVPTPISSSAPTTTATIEATSAVSVPDLFADRCGRCHGLERVNAKRYPRTEWETTVRRMQSNGLYLSDAERAALVDYLVGRQTTGSAP